MPGWTVSMANIGVSRKVAIARHSQPGDAEATDICDLHTLDNGKHHPNHAPRLDFPRDPLFQLVDVGHWEFDLRLPDDYYVAQAWQPTTPGPLSGSRGG
jgi:hypothetical protein